MKVLVVVDMQHDFVDGALGTTEAQAIVSKVAEKVKQYVEEDGIIVYTQDTHSADYMETMEGHYLPVPHCIAGTDGWRILPAVYVEDSYVVQKNTFGHLTLGQDVWQACLEKFDSTEIESIELCGVCTDICVLANSIILKTDYHYLPIIVDSSCCAGVTPEKHAAALEVMRSCQIEVI